MEHITRHDIYRLAAVESPECIAIYAPPRHVGADRHIDSTRVTNLLRTARASLQMRAAESIHIDELLLPIEVLAANRNVWEDPKHGVAIFRSPTVMEAYRVSIEIPELVRVDTCFDLLPLTALTSDDGIIFILSIAQGDVRLYRTTWNEAAEIPVDHMPKSLEEFERFDGYEQVPQQHSTRHTAVQSPSKQGTIFHSGPTRRQESKRDYRDFLREVERRVVSLVAPTGAPLVLAGVGEARKLFASLCEYRGLAPEGISGEYELSDLHGAARTITESAITIQRELAVDRINQLSGTGRTSDDIGEISKRAQRGEVEILLFADDVDDSSDLSQCVREILRQRGSVYSVPRSELHMDANAEALFRY